MAVGRENGICSNGGLNGDDHHIRYIPLTYDSAHSHDSALDLVLAVRPDWTAPGSNVEFVRFTDGITNTLLKAVNKRAGLSKDEIDQEAILLRAYGHGTDVIIDRHRETQNHELLMKHGLAPELLARFENGMMYRFVRGAVTQPEDLRKPEIYKAVARRLAQWHATVPCISGRTGHSRKNSRVEGLTISALDSNLGDAEFQQALDGVAPGKPPPNVWTVMQKWIFALPTETEAQRTRQAALQRDLRTLVDELSQRPGLGANGLVFAHCDLLSGNVIVLPKSHATSGDKSEPAVTFIDYEYATPSPAAFDLANHFAEWGGFDCDFSVLPTRAQRREFIAEYIESYFGLQEKRTPGAGAVDKKAEVEKLLEEVDVFRGVPGFYWGIWALIQATISEIDFDYASYAETRLGEYYAWRAETSGERQKSGKEMPLRERRWAQEK